MDMLDNPVWSTLTGRLASFGGSAKDTRWFFEDVAPFASIPAANVVPDLDAARAGGMADSIYFVGVCPDNLPRGWRYVSRSEILQMFPPNRFDATSIGVELGSAHREQMYALAQIAFPLFFRRRTAELGQYVGVFEGEQLIAMAGERMAFGSHQEVSGVCTHPRHVGRGLAGSLTRTLLRRHVERGLLSFLHVSAENHAARGLYKRMGYSERVSLAMGKVQPY